MKRLKVFLKENNKIILLSIVFLCFSAFVAFFCSNLISFSGFKLLRSCISGENGSLNDYYDYWRTTVFSDGSRARIERFVLLFVVNIILSTHIILGPRKVFEWIFDKRWIIGVVVLLFLVGNEYNGDSFSCYDSFIQPGYGSEFVNPIVGVGRPIRSDEWLVSNVASLHSYMSDGPSYSFKLAKIIMNPTVIISEVLYDFAGLDYAYSFDWFFNKILLFLISIDFFMIVTKKNKYISSVMSCVFIFSPFYQWWGQPGLWLPFLGSIVFFDRFFESKGLNQYIFGLITAFFANMFVFCLYPAWEVPMGYISIVFIIYIISKYYKLYKNVKITDYLPIVFSIICFITFVIICYIDRQQYIKNITATVYPGSRESAGGFSLYELFSYISGTFFSYKDSLNNSEFSSFITLFPLPIILVSIGVIKQKKKDILSIGMLFVFCLLFLYCSNAGLPFSVARKLMLTGSTPERAVDILAFTQLVFMAIYLSGQSILEIKEMTRIEKIGKLCVAFIICLSVSLYSLHVNSVYIPEYLTHNQKIIMIIVVFFLAFLLLLKDNQIIMKLFLWSILGYSLFTGLFSRPLCKGLDSIYSKPVAKEIISIKEEDPKAVWITTDSLVSQAYLSSCGVDVMNVVHSTPDMELWKKLDPTGQYDEVYNRYQHITISIVQETTSFELVQADTIKVNLSIKDVKTTNAKYLYSPCEVSLDNEYFNTTLLYAESNSFIYEINYK